MENNPRAVGNLLVMVLFACLGIVDLIAGDYLGASVWLALAAGLAFLGPESTPWARIPGWRRVAGLVALVVGVILFALQISRDFAS